MSLVETRLKARTTLLLGMGMGMGIGFERPLHLINFTEFYELKMTKSYLLSSDHRWKKATRCVMDHGVSVQVEVADNDQEYFVMPWLSTQHNPEIHLRNPTLQGLSRIILVMVSTTVAKSAFIMVVSLSCQCADPRYSLAPHDSTLPFTRRSFGAEDH